LLSTSTVTVTPSEPVYYDTGVAKYNLQLVVYFDHNTDSFTVSCYLADASYSPTADFDFNFIAVK